MKKLNILSKTDGWSSGHTPVTLGTTVGSPSVHRRGALLKLLSVLVLMVFGFGQVWAAEGDEHQFTNVAFNSLLNNGATISDVTITNPGYPVKKIVANCRYNKTAGGVTISITVGGETFGSSQTHNANSTVDLTFTDDAMTGDIVLSFTNNCAYGTGKGTFYLNSVTLTEGASAGGGDPVDPTITFNNGSVDAGYTLDLSTLFTSNSNGEVTYSITAGGTYASIDGSILTGVAAGSVTVQASQAATASYNAAIASSTITVNAHTVTPGQYGILFANAFWGTSETGQNAGHTASGIQNDIAVSISGNSGTQNYINNTETRIYGSHTLTFSVPTGYVLREITGLGTSSNSSISVATGSTGSISSRVWTGTANSVTFNIGGRTDFTTVYVTYEAVGACTAPSITTQPEGANYDKDDVATALSVVAEACDAISGSLSYQWYSNTSLSNEGGSVIAGKTDASFTPATDEAGDFYYYCVVTQGEASVASDAVKVSVVAPFTGSILEITKDDFATGSYTANDAGIKVGGFDFAVKDVYQNSSTIQAKASTSYIYNSIVFGEIVKIEITKSGASNNNFTVYEGMTVHPTSNTVTGVADGNTKTYTFSSGKTYFTLQNGGTYSTVNPIKIYYYPVKSAVTIDGSIENGSVNVTGAANLSAVAAGTELTLSNTPASGYKFGSYSVYKTGDTETTVTVTNGKFNMPAFDVTVSATFEVNKNLTGIALSGEYPTVFLTGDAFSHEGMMVTASYSNAADADVTADATFTGYDMSSASAQTVTVSYTEGTTKTQTYGITVKDAYTVPEILPLVPALNAGSLPTRVKGYISQIDQYNSTYNSITYWISVDGKTTSDQLEVYSGKNVGNTNFSSINDLEVGDFVTISGEVKTHTNGVKEFDKNNYIITGGRIQKGAVTGVVVSGTPTKTEYASGESFLFDGLVATATYENGYQEVVTPDSWAADPATVTATGTVAVTATVGSVTSPAYNVNVTVSAKSLVSIAVGTDSYTIYTGEALPKPIVTATFSEGEPEDVSEFAVYDSESVFDTEVIDNPDPQTITVSYTFGGATQTATYTVSVKDYENADDAPYTVTEALHIITDAIGNAESAREIVVAGTVSAEKVSNYKNRYKISDGANELLVYNGKGFNDEAFTDANYPKVGDVVIVKGKVINFQGNTPEFASGKSYLLSQIRPATIAIEDVASFEVGTADLAVTDLTVTTPSDGDITLVSGDEAKATIVANAIHAVAPGTVTITANLAATSNENALNYTAATTTFSVTVKAATIKYSITFNGNGADGGDAPEAIADKAAGEEVTLPANTYTKTGYIFTGWKVYDENQDEVTVTAGAFEMPASDVTIKAQWEEISEWAYVYTSNVEMSYTGTGSKDSVIISEAKYVAYKAGSGSNTGTIKVKLPYQTHTLHFHALAWNGKSSSISISGVSNASVASFDLTADAGANGSTGKYTLENNPVDQYFEVTFDAVDDEEGVELVFSKSSGDNRFIIYGVNQEGGVLPVLDRIEISGDLTNKSGYKVGDDLNMEGLTVNAIYTLNEVEQEPVDVTSDVEWSYDALVENQTEVTVTATYGEKQAQKTITDLEPVASADPKIYVSTLNVNFASVEVGESVPAAETVTVTLTNVASVTATLGGTNADAFSVSPASLTESGDITISILANTDAAASYSATLTISDGEEGAEDKTINLSFAVTEPVVEDDVTGTWTLVTSETTLAAGKKVIIAQYVDDDGELQTMAAQSANGNNRTAITSTVAGTTLTPVVGTKVMTLADAGEGHFYLMTSAGEYLYNASTSQKSYLKTKAEAENVSWTIAVTAEGVATIASVENTNRTTIFYNSSNDLFNCYASGQSDIALYMLEETTPEPPTEEWTEVRTGLNAWQYYTMCLDKAVTNVRGASIWRVLSKAANDNDVILEEVELPLDAGRPYFFYATAENLEVIYTGDAVGAPVNDDDNNGLVGSFEQAHIEPTHIGDVYTNYILWDNALYFVNSDNVYVGENRAYLDMTGVPPFSNEPSQGNAPRRRVTMTVNSEQNATGFDELNASKAPAKKVINGQLFILRGEKIYDSTGRLVK